MDQSPTFRFSIETPDPGHAPAGRLAIKGWCAATGHTEPPSLRLIINGEQLDPTERTERPDVVSALELKDKALRCGFVFEGQLPPGAAVAHLEASIAGNNWVPLGRFVVAASEAPLQAAIEHPGAGVVEASVRIQGWCAHPTRALSTIELHYGNRRVPCEFGLPREDVPRLLPRSPDSAKAGFITVKNISVGHGPLRIFARDTTGLPHLVTTGRIIDVRTDEENPAPLELAGLPARLGPRAPATQEPAPPQAKSPHRILFVLYGDMTSNSAIHVAALANELARRGHECIVAVPRDADTIRYHHGARFRCVDFAACGEYAELFDDAQPPDIIHAWTTSERVRRFALAIRGRSGAKLFIHLEDDEESILAASCGLSAAELRTQPAERLDSLVGEDHSHPLRRREFLAAADGCTLIIDRLHEFIPPGKPWRVFWPAAAPEFHPRPIPWDLRRELGWNRDHTVLFYHGNLHPTNCDEMASLYEAVVRLNRGGIPTTLIRTGRDFCALPGSLHADAQRHVVTLGRIGQNRHLAPLLSLADFFVQPGKPDAFNNHRFPSKLPEFFASGRPVILPRTNLGEVVQHRADAFVLETADAEGIAGAVRTLRAAPDITARLAKGATAFAEKHFSWARSADRLEQFYQQTLPNSANREPPATAQSKDHS